MTHIQSHRDEELRENLVPLVGLWPEVAEKLSITIKQAAEFVEKIVVRQLIILYLENECSGLWVPICEYTEQHDAKIAAQGKTKACLLKAWQSCEDKMWSDESRTALEDLRITHAEANEIWNAVEKLFKPCPIGGGTRVHHREQAVPTAGPDYLNPSDAR
jgi:hypothetical protein